MAKFLSRDSLTFDDVSILPRFSKLDSRNDVSVAVKRAGFEFEIPIISSNMDYITGPDMAITMFELGGFGILHRFQSREQQKSDATGVFLKNAATYVSLGVRDIDESLKQVDETYPDLDGVCIDVAHGHMRKVGLLVQLIRKKYPDLKVIAGNVATAEGFRYLAESGAHGIKVGIGAGAVCTTRVVTGIGVPQLSAILDCAEEADMMKDEILIISDGGIRNSGDIVKALAAGADMVMIGFLFAGTTQTPTHPAISTEGKAIRPYRGQSSFGINGERYTKEGIEGWIEERGSVVDIVHNLIGGLKSGMGYVGAQNLIELQHKAVFTKVTNNGFIEGLPRIQSLVPAKILGNPVPYSADEMDEMEYSAMRYLDLDG